MAQIRNGIDQVCLPCYIAYSLVHSNNYFLEFSNFPKNN